MKTGFWDGSNAREGSGKRLSWTLVLGQNRMRDSVGYHIKEHAVQFAAWSLSISVPALPLSCLRTLSVSSMSASAHGKEGGEGQ